MEDPTAKLRQVEEHLKRVNASKGSKTDGLLESTAKAVLAVPGQDEEEEDTTDVRLVMKRSFLKLSNKFLTSAARVWRSCPALQRWKAATDRAVAEDSDEFAQTIISGFFRAMNSHFTDVENKDSGFILSEDQDRFAGENIEEDLCARYMREISAREKWRLATPQIRETCWQYLRMLSRYATVYTVYEKIPTGMFRTILKVAGKLNDKRQQGMLNMAEITSKGLMATGNQILDAVDPKEKEEFFKALTDDESSEAMMAALQALVGHAAGGGGTGNLASMLMQAKSMR